MSGTGRIAAALCVAAGVATMSPSISQAFQQPPPSSSGATALNPRLAPGRTSAPAPGRARAQGDLRASLGPSGVVQVDRVTATPRVVARLDGLLSDASTQAPQSIVFDYVRAHRAAFGLSDTDLSRLKLARDYTSIDGTHHLVWAQAYGGVRAFDNDLRASVTAQGRLVNVMGSPISHLRVKSIVPRMSAPAALAAAYADAGVSRAPSAARSSAGPERATEFANGDQARLVLLAEGAGDVRLAWRARVQESSTRDYDYVVDAGDGAVLYRLNTVANATGRAWDYAPNIQAGPKAGLSGGAQVTKTFPASTSTTKLQSSFAHVYPDTLDRDTVDTPSASCPECGEVPPSSAGAWTYPFTVNAGSSSFYCSATFPQCSWDPSTPYSWRTNLRQDATQVFWFVNRFHDHLLAAPIGFTPAAGNFEGADAVIAEVDDGAQTAGGIPDAEHQNNANMLTPADGTPPRMQMYLLTGLGLGGYENAGDDASIVYHEYTHGLSNRLVSDASGLSALHSFQARAMGEGWSDWYAMDFLVGSGFDTDTATIGDVNVAWYSAGGGRLRKEPTDCSVDLGGFACYGAAGLGGFTFGDMGQIDWAPEVHADGEIWTQTLWELRQRLIADLGAATGVAHARSLITRAMELSPTDPSFLDMRNAILEADTVAGGGDRARIWDVFADRGMGFFASTIDASDTQPTEDFELPPTTPPNATMSGSFRDPHTGTPIAGATAEFASHASGFSSDYRATSNAVGAYTITGMYDGAYAQMRGRAPGYMTQTRDDVFVLPGANGMDFALQRDWASTSGGATVTSFTGPDYTPYGCGPGAALDQSLGSGWGSTSPDNPDSPGAKSFVVRLPVPTNVSAFAIDPGAVCGDDDGASLADYTIDVSTSASGLWAVARAGTFADADNHRLNYLRPTGSAVANVSYVRMTMASPQDTYFGSGVEFMDMAELVVYGGARPAIASFTPASAITGSTLTINGTSLAAASAVKVNGKPAAFTPVSPTRITATIPDGASTGKVAVTTPDGTATSAANCVVTLSITSFAPASGPAGTVVALAGTGFTSASVVKVGGVAAATTFVSPTQLRATIPAGAPAGAAPLTVTTASGTVTSPTSYTTT